jgi:hypothetical protein
VSAPAQQRGGDLTIDREDALEDLARLVGIRAPRVGEQIALVGRSR